MLGWRGGTWFDAYFQRPSGWHRGGVREPVMVQEEIELAGSRWQWRWAFCKLWMGLAWGGRPLWNWQDFCNWVVKWLVARHQPCLQYLYDGYIQALQISILSLVSQCFNICELTIGYKQYYFALLGFELRAPHLIELGRHSTTWAMAPALDISILKTNWLWDVKATERTYFCYEEQEIFLPFPHFFLLLSVILNSFPNKLHHFN
jgi:hypothetical protein